jgi:hypothetical protein
MEGLPPLLLVWGGRRACLLDGGGAPAARPLLLPGRTRGDGSAAWPGTLLVLVLPGCFRPRGESGSEATEAAAAAAAARRVEAAATAAAVGEPRSGLLLLPPTGAGADVMARLLPPRGEGSGASGVR